MMKKFRFRGKKKKLIPEGLLEKETKNFYLMADDQDDSQIKAKGINDFKSLKLLYYFAKPLQFEILFALFLIFSSSGLAMLSSKFMGDLLEKGLILRNLNNSLLYSFLILAFEGLSIFFIWIGRKKLSTLSSKVIFTVRESLFVKLHNLPLQYYDRQPQGRIVTRVTHDVEGIEDFFTSSLGNLISALMMTFLAVSAMLLTNFKLGLLMVVSIIPSLVIVFLTKDMLKNSNRKTSKFSSAINAKLSEYINGIEVIRSFGLENWSMKNFSQSVDNYLYAHLKGNSLYSWSMPLISFCATLPLIGLVWYGGLKVLNGAITLGVFVSFVRYYERFFNPMMLLSREIHVVQQAFTSTERVMNFLSEEEEDLILRNIGNMKITHIMGDIKFHDVSMRYGEGDYVLKELNFHIKAGEKIGFVGKTGCGKSSTVSLMSRLYEFQEGDILFDDISIRSIDRHTLRDQIGFVSQDAIIFKGTLKENLTSNPNISDQELTDAARKTGLLKVLSKTGFNLEMEIEEGGTNLSTGEKQLVSLTRVLIKNPSILILDEATANIDPYYEKIIHDTIMDLMLNRTCIMIAHRLDTLKECDRIFVFNQGKLVEAGSLDELLANQNYFYQLHSAQSIH